jgi:hypothetical protein
VSWNSELEERGVRIFVHHAIEHEHTHQPIRIEGMPSLVEKGSFVCVHQDLQKLSTRYHTRYVLHVQVTIATVVALSTYYSSST